MALLVNRTQYNDQFATDIKNTAGRSRSNKGKWIKIGIIGIIVLVLLYWMFGTGGEKHH